MPKVTIYTDIFADDLVPHTFLGITDSKGNTIYRGFSPDRTGLKGPGSIKDEYNYKENRAHPYSSKKEFEISQSQYDDLTKNIDNSSKNPPDYNLPKGAQCTVWAMDMLYKSGVIDSFGIFKPNTDMGESNPLAGLAQTLLINPYIQHFGSFIDDLFGINYALDYWRDKFTLPTIYDPLILDLDGDGIETTTLEEGAYFDHNGDNMSFKTSWVGKDDALLVVDKDLNNQIDNGNELFGNFTKLKDNTNPNNNQTAKFAINGFHALRQYDSDNNSVIDINDKEFKNLKLWQDLNGNAKVDEGELFSLEEKGIKSINLNHTISNETLNKDNTKELTSTFTKLDGSVNEIADINFKVDTTDCIHNNKISLDEKYTNLAYIKGYGFLRNLHEAASLSDILYKTINDYMSANTKEEQLQLLETLVKEWSNTTGKTNSYSLNKSTIVDSNTPEIKIINLVEKLNDNNIDKDMIYDEIVKLSKSAKDARFKDGSYLVEILKNNNNKLPNSYMAYKNIRLTPSQNNNMMLEKIDESLLKEFDSVKYKLQIIDNFRGEVTPPLYYNSADDIKAIINNINKAYENILNFTYKSLLAQTRLKEYMGLMELEVEESVNSGGNSDYEFKLNSKKVIAKFSELNKTNPKKAFIDLAEFIELFENKNNIKDGLILLSSFAIAAKEQGVLDTYAKTLGEIKFFAKTGSGEDDIIISSSTLGNGDTLHGGEGDDILVGAEGDDILYGEKGNDTLMGGKGNDVLQGAEGDDTYIFNRGDGQDKVYDSAGNDTIEFGEGISKEDVIFTKINNNLSIKYGSDCINVSNHFSSNNAIERISLSDGSFIDSNTINKIIQDLNSYANDNAINLNKPR